MLWGLLHPAWRISFTEKEVNMKKKSISLARVFPALLLCLLCLIPTAYADMGPKPELTITVLNAPEGTLYIDLLAEGTPNDMPYNDQSGLDQTVLEQLHSLEGDGWVLVVSTGRSVPVFGDVYPSGYTIGKPTYHFSYTGLPSEFKLAAATADEVKTSELFVRERFYTNVVYDWAANTLTYTTSSPLLLGAQLASTLVPTLIIEGLVLWLFGFRTKRSWLVFLCVNVVTQIALHLVCDAIGMPVMQAAYFWMFYLFLLVPELVIWGVEAAAYAALLPEHSRGRRVGYAFAANILSYAVSYLPLHLLYGPISRL